jgi:hypothetical protein
LFKKLRVLESTEKQVDWATQLQKAQQLVNQYLSEERNLVAELI